MTYRQDIDGLRAISIVGVLIFHFFGAPLPGGFLGVDVFFVISGFLIVGLIIDEINDASFSFLRFYERRIRRLVPAAVVVTLTTCLASWLLLLPPEFLDFCKSVAASATFFSNWYFLATVGYFDGPAIWKPLLHTWSLSIEEQFYLVAPAVMVACARRRKVGALLALSFTASLGFAIWLNMTTRFDAAFYNSFARIWELSLGGLTAVAYRRKLEIPQLLAFFFRAIGIIVVGATFFLTSIEPTYHLLSVCSACAGAALLLIAPPCERDGLLRLLSSSRIRFVGQISYSLYLWHWPVLVFGRLLFEPLAPSVLLGLIVLTFALSTATYYLVENPIRQRRLLIGMPRVYTVSALTTCAVLVFAANGVRTNGAPDRLPAHVSLALAAHADVDGATYPCFDPPGTDFIFSMVEKANKDELCLIGKRDPAKIDFVVWGDSHGWATSPALIELAEKYGVTGILANYAGCPPLVGTHNGWRGTVKSCTEFYDAVEKIIQKHGVKNVFLIARWSLYTVGTIQGSEAPASPYLVFDKDWTGEPDRLKVFEQSLFNTVRQLRNTDVYLFKEIPEQRQSVYRVLASNKLLHRSSDEMWTTWQMHTERHERIDDIIASIAKRVDNLAIIDPIPRMCPDRKCIVEIGGKPLYWDEDHLSRTGAKYLEPVFEQAFQRMVKGNE